MNKLENILKSLWMVVGILAAVFAIVFFLLMSLGFIAEFMTSYSI